MDLYLYKANLIKVVDGDTLDVEIDLGFNTFIKERVRILGIDSAESRTSNEAEKTWGLAAKARLAELVPEHFVIRTEYDPYGKYGRVLASVLVGDVNVGNVLIEEKLAIPYDGGNRDENREKYGIMELWNTMYDANSLN